MATKNTFQIKIDNIDYSSHIPFPISSCELHDERLNECNFKIKNIKRRVFKPLTTVVITENDGENTTTTRYLVADDKSEEFVLGSKKYNHEIYAIEETKYLEGIIVNTCGFNNKLSKTDNKNIVVSPDVSVVPSGTTISNPSYVYISPILAGTILQVVPNAAIFENYKNVIDSATKVYLNDNLINQTTDRIAGFNITTTVGTYKIVYEIDYETTIIIGNISMKTPVAITASYEIQSLEEEDEEATKPITLTEAINRVLDIAIIQTKGKNPKFILNQEQSNLFENIISPEFNFTQNNLREILKEIGSYIDSEPRLENGVIYFDKYVQSEYSTIKTKPYSLCTANQNVEQFANQIDSSVQNLVNQISYAEGAIVEPYKDGFITTRTETVNARIEDNDSLIIPTSRPIYDIVKLECGYLENGTFVGDITSYLFEESEYLLSDPYEANGRGNKIYFTQGQQNIKGLTFQVLSIPILNEQQTVYMYAIQRVIQLVTQLTNLQAYSIDVTQLAFKITYIPFYNTRLTLTKPIISSLGKRRALNYNQSANIVETKYYARRLSNVINRIGNIEKSYSFYLRNLNDIPKVGQLYDKDYVISVVSRETTPDYYKITIGITNRYNNISNYIGISSQKRYAEISEKQSYDRNITYTDYLVFGEIENKFSDTLLTSDALDLICKTFIGVYDDIGINNTYRKITCVESWGEDENGNDIGNYNLLPVVSSAFSRCLNFSFAFEDNYSAGQQSIKKISGEVNGFFARQCPYTDRYGRIEFLNLNFKETIGIQTSSSQNIIGNRLPEIDKPTTSGIITTGVNGTKALRIKKMGNERILFNYNLEYVTTEKTYILGDALANLCPLIRGDDVKSNGAHMYILNREISVFDKTIQLQSDDILQADFSQQNAIPGYVYVQNNQIKFMKQYAKSAGKSWVLIDRITNELFLGCNIEISKDDEIQINPINFAHEIFD